MAHFPTVAVEGVGPNASISEGRGVLEPVRGEGHGGGRGQGVRREGEEEGEEECNDECGMFSVNWARVICDE